MPKIPTGNKLSQNRIHIEDTIEDVLRDCENLEFRDKKTYRVNDAYCKNMCTYYYQCQEAVF